MAKTVRTVDSEDLIEKVEVDLNRLHLSAMPVVSSDGSVFGIISSIDLLHFHAAKKNPKAVRAWELCTYKPISVPPDTAIAEVAQLMLAKHIHHVLVTDGKVLLGIVSSFDFVQKYLQAPLTAP